MFWLAALCTHPSPRTSLPPPATGTNWTLNWTNKLIRTRTSLPPPATCTKVCVCKKKTFLCIQKFVPVCVCVLMCSHFLLPETPTDFTTCLYYLSVPLVLIFISSNEVLIFVRPMWRIHMPVCWFPFLAFGNVWHIHMSICWFYFLTFENVCDVHMSNCLFSFWLLRMCDTYVYFFF